LTPRLIGRLTVGRNVEFDLGLENQFTAHNLCDYDHRQQVEATINALLATIDKDTPVEFQPCDVSKEIQSLKLRKAYGLDAIPN
jgi:hypothetical protein